MAIRKFLATHQVFNAQDFNAAFPDSATDRNLLARAVKSGKVEHVRRGLYVSKTGRFEDTQPDPFDVAAAVTDDAVFCYLSALQLHGLLHNVAFRIDFFTHHRISPFTYNREAFHPLAYPQGRLETRTVTTALGKRFCTTSLEQTMVDCVSDAGRAGGAENVLRSLSSSLLVDVQTVVNLVSESSQATRVKVGWVLERNQGQWRVDPSVVESLHKSVGTGPYYFDGDARQSRAYWVPEWRLYLPHSEEEMVSWLTS